MITYDTQTETLTPGRFNLVGQQQTAEIIAQADLVSELRRDWDAACRTFDRTGTLPSLLDMQSAVNKLTAAENELVAMKEQHTYELSLTQPKNVRPFDAETEDFLDSQYPWRN